ncbi:class I SAM-dependent methyltransferase [Helcococcus kunzii]|uniref:class I SAM-dependent DNA methyltransferase n=1 Tax=Helcococcus kunzii TaxID=40091 RepID=UPI001BB09A82|nr:class I SAM-dependent methyltransferase [Helcococcus kunzii]QUY64505.1 class I SAM-dependent methyltransferase [Helcococcus kunzii]QZO76918.1 class I SAM-dependent methyltransferase [Helcococcus kunzii]
MYNRFSDFYDQLVFDINYKKYSKNIIDLLKKHKITDGQLLEIGCGTGNLTQKLAKNENFSILAFDNSIDMLNHAFTKLIDFDNVNLIMQDMYKFNYKDYQFDAVITLLDVINYITDKDKLITLFSNIYTSLKDGGIFIFDLNSRYKLIDVLGNNHFIYEKNDIFYTWENQLEDNLVYFNLNFFIKNENSNSYERFTEEQVERYYSIEEIIEILQSIGFSEIDYFDEDGGKFTENKTQRILFSAKK